MLDPGQRLTDAGDLAPCLPAAAEHAQGRSVVTGEILGRDTAGGAGAELAQLVRFDHARELGPRDVEEHDDERRPPGQPRVRLHPGEAELAVDRRHHREGAVLQPQPLARPVLDLAGGESPEAALDGFERVGRRQQRADVRFRQIERQDGEV